MAELNNSNKRLLLTDHQQRSFIENVKSKSGMTWEELASIIPISSKTLREWRNGKYSLNKEIATYLANKFDVDLPKGKVTELNEIRKRSAVLGGKAVMKKYGKVPVDNKKRKLAWRQWWKSVEKSGKLPKQNQPIPIKTPTYSNRLSEFTGIMIGDGSVSHRQIRVTLNQEDDAEYIAFVKELISELFDAPVSLINRKNKKAVDLTVSRTALVRFCKNSLGLPQGDKLRQSLDIPQWVKQNQEYKKSCLRGLVDTDGCIFWERHKAKDSYRYPRLNFTTASSPLAKSVKKIFKSLGFNPKTRRQGRSIQLENHGEICHYFEVIGTSNPKHLTRFRDNTKS